MKITVYHNLSRDNWFGLNRTIVENKAISKGFDYQYIPASHPLVKVFEYDQPDVELDPAKLLADIYRLFNVGDDPHFGTPSDLAKRYRSRRLRSLSVGDVVRIGDQAYSCESVGWQERAQDQLDIVAGIDAQESVVRERYEIGPREQLVCSLPWDFLVVE